MWFRKTVIIKKTVSQAKVAITADNAYELYVNGKPVGSDSDWTSLETYDITAQIRQGENAIAVKATDPGGDLGALLLEGAIVYTDNASTPIATDKTWKVSTSLQEGWDSRDFDDVLWSAPKVIGKPPVGPWGGIEHPSFVPKTPLHILSIDWPAGKGPGSRFSVSCRVKPDARIAMNTPVGLRVLVDNETVCEQWIEPPVPTSKWKQGVAQSIAFKDFYLPIYVPVGKMKVQVVTNATKSVGGVDVVIGSPKPVVKAPEVSVSSLSVKQVFADGKRCLDVSAKVSGAVDGQSYLFALFNGKVMMFAENINSANTRITIPENIPAGKYEAKLLPHLARLVSHKSAWVTLDGSSDSKAQALGYGTYVDRDGIPHRWYVNRAGALIWDGKPYIPAGAMYLSKFFMDYNLDNVERHEDAFRYDVQCLTKIKQAGITDVYLNPCADWFSKPAWVWRRFADLCENMGIGYGIQVSHELTSLKYFDISSDDYNVSVKSGEAAAIDIPSPMIAEIRAENKVFYAAYDKQTGALLDTGLAKVTPAENRSVHAEATPRVKGEHQINVHFTPEIIYQAGMRDYWTDVNEDYKADLDRFFSSLKLGPGLRNWIDPLDNEQSFQDSKNRMLPNTPGFHRMYAQHLQSKYGTISDALKAWAISNVSGKISFETMARMISIGQPSVESDTLYLLDPATGTTCSMTKSSSKWLGDMLQFRASSVADFNNQVANWIKQHHDVPVVLKHDGCGCMFNGLKVGGIDGYGGESYGTDINHLKAVNESVHTEGTQCGHTMWELTTETGPAAPIIGYRDPLNLFDELGSMIEVGSKGTYCFLLKYTESGPNGDWYTFNLFEDPRQLYWLGSYCQTLKSSQSLPDYSPESVGNRQFVRDVLDMQPLDLGPAFQALQFDSTTYVWNKTPDALTLKLDAPEGASVTFGDGSTQQVTQARELGIPVAANYAKPVIIKGVNKAVFTNIDDANLAAAKHRWSKARNLVREMGMPANPPSDSAGWQEVLDQAIALENIRGDWFADWKPALKVDGDLSEWKDARPMQLMNDFQVEASRYEDAVVYVGYDKDYLYVAGEIKDPTVVNNYSLNKLWNGDAVEVFIDLRPDENPGSPVYTDNCFQFIFAPTSADGRPAMTVISPGLAPDTTSKSSKWAVTKDGAGWKFEAAVSRLDLKGQPFQPTNPIGFNVQLDQSDKGDRTTDRILHGNPDMFSNRLRFGRLGFAWPAE